VSDDTASRKRVSRHIRASYTRPFRLTERDAQIVKAVNDFRVMRQDQLQRLFFPSRNTAQVRLQLLWQHGFLKREFLPVVGGIQTSPILYLIDRRGIDLLQSKYGYEPASIRWSRKGLDYQFVEHTLGLAEVRVAAELACRKHSYQLSTWLDERSLKSDYDKVRLGNVWVPVLPDAYLVVRMPTGDVHFFVEFDRGPESLALLKRKLTAYGVFYLSGKCKARYGTDRIRVLLITQSPTEGKRNRLDNIRQLATQLGESRWFWFTRLNTVGTRDFLSDPIWWLATSTGPVPLIG
jgi:hypothetical protein